MRAGYLLLGVVIAALAVFAYGRMTTGKVTTPALATMIDLNPALFRYPGASSISGGPR